MTFHSPSLAALQASPLQQHPAFAAALSRLGRPPKRVLLADRKCEVQVMVRRFGPLTLGLISRADVARPDLGHLRAATGCRVLVVNGETPGGRPGLCLRSAPSVAEMSLTLSAADMRVRMKQKWRNRLNRAMERGLKVKHVALPDDPGHWLLRIEQAQQRAKRYRGYPAHFAAAFAAANRGKARLFEARQGTEVIAAMLFLCHGSCATYHVGWSGPEGRAASAHNRLLWEAMIQLPRHGIERLELGVVDTEAAPQLARFKLGSGATCRMLGDTRLLLL